MMYYTFIAAGEKKGTQLFESENYDFARTAAENYKRDTGINCYVESRAMVYTTQTLDEAMAAGSEAVAYDPRRAARVLNIVRVGDHAPEARRASLEWEADAMRQGR